MQRQEESGGGREGERKGFRGRGVGEGGGRERGRGGADGGGVRECEGARFL
jgi:hypothetical protein